MATKLFTKEFPQGVYEVYDDEVSFEKVHCNQTHGNNILNYLGHNNYIDADGILIGPKSYPNTSIAVKTADCLPIVLIGNKVAIIHAGWRGLHNKILENPLLLKEKFSTAFIGPSIQEYEVSSEFKENFKDSLHFYEKNGKLFFNLQQEAQSQLENNYPGIKVYNSNICTLKEKSYNSFRRNQTKKRNWNIFKIN